MKEKAFKKGDFLQRPGQPAPLMYFINAGFVRAYAFDEDKENTIWFQNEGNAVVSVISWYHRTATDEYIEALEDTHIHYITREQLDLIYDIFPEFNYHGRVLTEQYYPLVWEWFNLVRFKNASDRHKFFVNHFGDWVKRVQSKHIASFLGLSPAHFSVSKKQR